jgi:mannose-1-phosphate guanylyltransferase
MPGTKVLIMAGGAGSRLWPVSRPAKPKQFYDLLGSGQTMLQHTYQRALALCQSPEDIRVITLKQWGDLVREQLPGIREEQLLLEPVRKQTAPATYFGLLSLLPQSEADMVVILPCDHYVLDQERFTLSLQTAIRKAREAGWVMVMGVQPTRPESNYGYVQFVQEQGPDLTEDASYPSWHKVKTFTDQPSPELANTFYRSGDFVWYTGIKVGSLGAFLDLYRRWLPDLVEVFEPLRSQENRAAWPALLEDLYPLCNAASFREGILDKAEGLRVQIGDFGWGDLTYWAEIYREHEKDYFGNAVNGAHVALFDAHHNMIHITGQRIALIDGLENYIVADSPDGILVCPRDKEATLRQRLAMLRRQQSDKPASDKGSKLG